MCACFQLAKDELNSADIALFLHGDPSQINPSLPLEEQAGLLPYDEEIEFPKERLRLGQQIGSGAFGRVVRVLLSLCRLQVHFVLILGSRRGHRHHRVRGVLHRRREDVQTARLKVAAGRTHVRDQNHASPRKTSQCRQLAGSVHLGAGKT